MSQIKTFIRQLERESVITRKMLSQIPNDHYDWKPHPKSMTIRQLAAHIAELPAWISMVLHTSELDFATSPYTPEIINNTETLMAYFEKKLEEGRTALEEADDAQLSVPWTLRNGNEIYNTSPKEEVIEMSVSQIIHHRAQLGVFLRLLEVPIPGSYGPSADESNFG